MNLIRTQQRDRRLHTNLIRTQQRHHFLPKNVIRIQYRRRLWFNIHRRRSFLRRPLDSF